MVDRERLAELERAASDRDASVETLLAYADALEEAAQELATPTPPIVKALGAPFDVRASIADQEYQQRQQQQQSTPDDDRLVTFANLFDVLDIIGQEVKQLLDQESAATKAALESLRRDLTREAAIDRATISDATHALRGSVGGKNWKQQRRARNSIQ